MAEKPSNNGLFGLFETGLDISLGAAHKSIEMARSPSESASKIITGMMSMLAVPAEAGPQLQDKAQAIAQVWMAQGMAVLSECKVAGEKYKNGVRSEPEK